MMGGESVLDRCESGFETLSCICELILGKPEDTAAQFKVPSARELNRCALQQVFVKRSAEWANLWMGNRDAETGPKADSQTLSEFVPQNEIPEHEIQSVRYAIL